MKIAMIGQKRVPSREGGVEIHVEEIGTRLADMGYEVTIYNRRRNWGRAEAGNYFNGMRLVEVPTINVKSLDAIVYSFLATIHALFRKYDVIHYHAEGPCAMLILPHLCGIRTVATIHGLDWQRAKWGGFATRFLLHGEKTAAKYADEVIVLSRNVQRYFREKYGREARYIPNGVNPPDIREPDIISKKYGLGKDDYILFLARIVPEKGLHYLLDAFREVDTNKKLVVAGAGSHTDDYVAKVKEMAARDDRVTLTGFVQDQELDELYSNAFLYVLPSDIEGMPISLLEAMSYGCRCLVSDIPENVEVVGECGYSFQKGNVCSLREELGQIINNNSTAIGDDVKDIVSSKYEWGQCVIKLATNVYHTQEENHGVNR